MRFHGVQAARIQILGVGVAIAISPLAYPLTQLHASGGSPVRTEVAQPPSSARFTQVSAGGDGQTGTFACGLDAAQTVRCWGKKTDGQTTAPAGTFSQVRSGGGLACALSTVQGGKNAIVCWGSKKDHATSPPAGTFSQISVGAGSACALEGQAGTPGKVTCWGADGSTPKGLFTSLSTGEPWCGVAAGGTIKCWTGWGVPKKLAGKYTQVTVGSSGFLCGLLAAGAASCAGGGDGTAAKQLSGTYSQLTGGFYEVCGLRAPSGHIQCGGVSQYPAPSGTFTDLSVGLWMYNCAVRTGGKVVCFSR